jgi:hypothetical protein
MKEIDFRNKLRMLYTSISKIYFQPYLCRKQVFTIEKSSTKTCKKVHPKDALGLVDYDGKYLANSDS